jgi:hypothetical protein
MVSSTYHCHILNVDVEDYFQLKPSPLRLRTLIGLLAFPGPAEHPPRARDVCPQIGRRTLPTVGGGYLRLMPLSFTERVPPDGINR